MAHKTGCLVCGDELIYGELEKLTCDYCGQESESQAVCSNGHYICDHCHTFEPIDFLEHYINKSKSTNPIAMINEVMKHPSYNMHGPEHHYLIPAIFLTAIKNKGYEVSMNYWQLVMARCADLPGGICGFWGACASAIGNGIAVSILKECNPGKKEYYGEIHSINTAPLNRIAEVGGPRCCKRNTILAAESLQKTLFDKMDIELDEETFVCSFMKNNQECIALDCPYFPGSKQ